VFIIASLFILASQKTFITVNITAHFYLKSTNVIALYSCVTVNAKVEFLRLLLIAVYRLKAIKK